MDDWEEYLGSQRSNKFVQYYRCRPISLLNKENVDDDGNRIIMPQSALERLSSLEVEYPMMFEIQNASTQKVSHCGVLEFVADEGFIHIPGWMMAHLGLEENDLVLMKNTSLPKGTFVKLQPHTMDFLNDVSNPGDLLEYNFSKYTCVTVGETITVTEFDKRYYLDVVEARPANAVATLETDCEVEFATPLDYKEPAAPPPEIAGSQCDEKPEQQQPVRFAGVGMRVDGKPVEQQTPDTSVAPAPAGSSVKGRKVLRFGGASAAAGGKTEKKVDDKEEASRFPGKKYSLADSMEE